VSDDRSVTDSLVYAVLAGLAIFTIATIAHYLSRGRDWWRLCADDPELYALTFGERTLFLISAWAFPAETALLFAGSLAIALAGTTAFAIPAAVFGGILLLSLALLVSTGAEASSYSSGDGDFYEGFWE
jgi:hypothetical protein